MLPCFLQLLNHRSCAAVVMLLPFSCWSTLYFRLQACRNEYCHLHEQGREVVLRKPSCTHASKPAKACWTKQKTGKHIRSVRFWRPWHDHARCTNTTTMRPRQRSAIALILSDLAFAAVCAQDCAGQVESNRFSTPLTLAERQRIVAAALATDQQDAAGLLRRQRARLDACGPHIRCALIFVRLRLSAQWMLHALW